MRYCLELTVINGSIGDLWIMKMSASKMHKAFGRIREYLFMSPGMFLILWHSVSVTRPAWVYRNRRIICVPRGVSNMWQLWCLCLEAI